MIGDASDPLLYGQSLYLQAAVAMVVAACPVVASNVTALTGGVLTADAERIVADLIVSD